MLATPKGAISMKKIFVAVVAVLLSLILFLFSGCDSLISSLEDEETTLPFSTSKTEQPDTKEAVVAYFNSLIEKAEATKTGLTRKIGFEINDLKIVGRELEGVTDENGNQQSDPDLKALNAAAKEVRSFILKSIKSNEVSVDYGNDWGENAPNTISSPSYAKTAKCVMGEEETEEGDTDIVYTNYYNGEMSFDSEVYPLAVNSVLATIFPYPDEEKIIEELNKMSDYLVLEDYDGVFVDNTISFSSERTVDEIDYANYTSNFKITAHAKGVGKLESYGELTVTFTLKCINNYNFNWIDPSVEVTD